jgi:hypothetical protein
MKDSPVKMCESSGCEALAVKHVHFGFRVFEPEIRSSFYELDLCETHLAEINEQFLFVNECELSESSGDNSGNNAPTFKHAA